MQGCDSIEWDLSQSGRRKQVQFFVKNRKCLPKNSRVITNSCYLQNFGPKTNFKKMKINGKSFAGFPKFSQHAQKKLNEVPLLSDFQTIEQCAIEYRLETGACIDPHIDDCWVWGERVISINLLSDSVLTMTKYVGGIDKYNLRYHYDHNPDSSNPFLLTKNGDDGGVNNCKDYPIVRLRMPGRSLLVLYGASRYEWEHSILRRDIFGRRICMAYREFTGEYLQGGRSYSEIGQGICERAQNFDGCGESGKQDIIL